MKESVGLSVYLPKTLRARVKEVGERLCLSATAIIRQSLEKELVVLEERIVKEDAERARLKAQRKAEKLHFSTRKISERVTEREDAPEDAAEPLPPDRLQEVYRRAAEQVLLDTSDREAIKRVLADALKAVQRECPLTYPDDATVVREIEREVKRQRDSGPAETRGIDSIVDAASPSHPQE